MITFFVEGCPIAQPRHRVGKYGGYIPKEHKIHEWKERIISKCKTINIDTIDNAVSMHIVYYMPRPKAHFNKSGLKPNAPDNHIKKPDIDNLNKAVFDSLVKANIIKDDSFIVCSHAYKQYANILHGALITIKKV